MDYNIPPTTFLPIEQDDFSNYRSEPEEEKRYTFLQQVRDIVGVLSITFAICFLLFTLIEWPASDRTLKEVFIKNFNAVKSAPSDFIDYAKELYNRKSLEEIRAERIKGLPMTETWGHNINALFPTPQPDSIYLEPSDLYIWTHPQMIATIGIVPNIITYYGSPSVPTVPTSPGTYTVQTVLPLSYIKAKK